MTNLHIFVLLSNSSIHIYYYVYFLNAYSSIPPQYVGNNTIQHDGCGDVVIVVPGLDPDHIDSELIAGLPEHTVCIDADPDIEPNSPKTITESSSKTMHINCWLFCFLGITGCWICQISITWKSMHNAGGVQYFGQIRIYCFITLYIQFA